MHWWLLLSHGAAAGVGAAVGIVGAALGAAAKRGDTLATFERAELGIGEADRAAERASAAGALRPL